MQQLLCGQMHLLVVTRLHRRLSIVSVQSLVCYDHGSNDLPAFIPSDLLAVGPGH